MNNKNENQCPDINTLAEFLDHPGSGKIPAEVSAHIATCPECRDLCSFAAAAKIEAAAGKLTALSEAEKEEHRRNLQNKVPLNPPAETEDAWKRFTIKLADLFSFQDEMEVVAASETMAEITFASLPYVPPQYSWRMTLAIPSQLSEKLKIQLRTHTTAAANGKLIFCGNELQVRNGEAELRYDDLRKTFHVPEVSFCFKDGKTVPGYPEI